MCAAPPPAPVLPDDAGIPQPITDVERAAVAAFLGWVARLGDHDAALKARALKASAWCAK